MRTNAPDYIITFDGGSRGNPGEGYGSYELRSSARSHIERLQFGDRVTNNEAEYRTLIAALHDLIGRIAAQDKRPDGFTVAVRGDSQLVIYQVTGQWKVRNARIRPLYEEATALLKQFGAVDVRWHPRTNSVRTLGH